MQPINPRSRPQVRPFDITSETNRLRSALMLIAVYAIQNPQPIQVIRDLYMLAIADILTLRGIAEHAAAHLCSYMASNPDDWEWIESQQAELISFLEDCGFTDLAEFVRA